MGARSLVIRQVLTLIGTSTSVIDLGLAQVSSQITSHDVIGHIKRQSALSVKKTLDLISEKYGNTLLPEAASIEEVANDETVPDLLAEEMDYSGKSVVLDEGE